MKRLWNCGAVWEAKRQRLDELGSLSQSLCRSRQSAALHCGCKVLCTCLRLLPPRSHSLECGHGHQLFQIPLRHDELVRVNHFDAQGRDYFRGKVLQIGRDYAVCMASQRGCQHMNIIGIRQL